MNGWCTTNKVKWYTQQTRWWISVFSKELGLKIGLATTFIGVLFADIFLIMAGAIVIAMETRNEDE